MGQTFAGPSIQYTDASPSSLSTNWHKAGVSYDASTSMVTYILDSWYNRTSTVDLPTDVTGSGDAFVRLGTNLRSDLNYNGLLDDVCVYDRALTASELTSVVEGCMKDANLKLELNFDQDGPDHQQPSIYDSASSAFVGYSTSTTSDGLILGFGNDNIVSHAPSYSSSSPPTSPTLAIVCPSTSSTCDLTFTILSSCDSCTSISLNSITFGSIAITEGSTPPETSTYVLTLTDTEKVTGVPR